VVVQTWSITAVNTSLATKLTAIFALAVNLQFVAVAVVAIVNVLVRVQFL